jgi:transposase-like protein
MPDQAMRHDSHSKAMCIIVSELSVNSKLASLNKHWKEHCLCFLSRQAKTQQPPQAIPMAHKTVRKTVHKGVNCQEWMHVADKMLLEILELLPIELRP